VALLYGRFRWLRMVVVTATLLVTFSRAASAGPLRVEFDCYPVIACHEVTPDEPSELKADERLIEARIRISARIIDGSADDLREFLFEIRSPERRARVDDFAPKTQMDSDVVEPILITKSDERHRSIGLGLGGKVGSPTLVIEGNIEPNAKLGMSRKESVARTMKKRPPKQPIVISGTMLQGHGVFFKLRPTSQTSMEGVHEIVCHLRVPADWRGDWLLLGCRAEGELTRYFVKSQDICGQARYVLGLHDEGDQEAKEAAEQLAQAQTVRNAPAATDIDVQASLHKSQLRASSEALARHSGGEAGPPN